MVGLCYAGQFARRPEEKGKIFVWKCSSCGEVVDDEFDACWHCQGARGESQSLSGTAEPVAVWRNNFQERLLADGSLELDAFGRRMSCPICDNGTFRECTAGVKTGVLLASEMVTVNYYCAKCGYVFWFRAT